MRRVSIPSIRPEGRDAASRVRHEIRARCLLPDHGLRSADELMTTPGWAAHIATEHTARVALGDQTTHVGRNECRRAAGGGDVQAPGHVAVGVVRVDLAGGGVLAQAVQQRHDIPSFVMGVV